MPEFTRPFLYDKQRDAMFCSARWGVIEASTKSGKTVSAIAWLIEQALKGKAGSNYWWVAPGYIQSDIAFRRIKGALTRGSFTPYESPTPRIALLNGTFIWFKSADNPDALYGEDVYAVVVDEASRVSEGSWHAVRSTLTATRGPGRLIGNVKGRKNWFYRMARRAESGAPNMHYSKITAKDAVDAGVLDAEEIEDARQTLPEAVFRELYYAEPSDDGGNPFGLGHIATCIREGLAEGPVVAWGIDLAKKQDYFVAIGLNEKGGVAAFHRWKGVPWRVSIRRVRDLVGEDTPALVDSTGLGDPVLEELQEGRGNFSGYLFTARSKQKLMEGLAVSIQGHEITYPEGVIVTELEAFEYVYTRTGVAYAAAEGFNDDTVAALALARQMWTEAKPGASIMEYYATTATRLSQEAYAEETHVAKDTLPWQDEPPDRAAAITNELDDLYRETLSKIEGQGPSRKCERCGKPVLGPTRVSDGFKTWHIECVGMGVAA